MRITVGRSVRSAMVAASGVGVLAAVLLSAAPALAVHPGSNGAIALTQCPYYCGVSLVDQNGTKVLTAGGVYGSIGSQVIRNDSEPAWSPDGEWLAFQRNDRPAGNPFAATSIWVMRKDGTQARKVYDLPPLAVEDLSWSPDGSKIAFNAIGGISGRGLTIVNASGPASPHIVTPTSYEYAFAHPQDFLYVRDAEWSPNAADTIAIAYAQGSATVTPASTTGIGLIDTDATDATGLTPIRTLPLEKPGGGCCNYASYDEPTWSPGGTRLAYTHTELDASLNPPRGTTRVETVDPDGTDVEVVIDYPQGNEDGAAFAGEPMWSPDGQWIAWKLTQQQSAKWEGAHPAGSARGDLPLVGGQADWQPCTLACASVFPGWVPPQPPTVTIGDASVTEGDAGTVTATFTITRSGAPSALGSDSSIGYTTSPGTAAVGADYVDSFGQVAFTQGETSKVVSVTVNGDAVDEPDETFVVTLSGAINATIGDAQGTGTILDDDPPPPTSSGGSPGGGAGSGVSSGGGGGGGSSSGAGGGSGQQPGTARPRFTALDTILMPGARRCVSRRKLTIRLREMSGVRIRSVAAWVNGGRKRVRSGGGPQPVVLRNLPARKAIIRLKVTGRDGRSVERTRTFRTCSGKRR